MRSVLCAEMSLNHLSFTGAQEEVIEIASLQGIAKVFDEYMCSAIRRVAVQSDLKAAVTTALLFGEDRSIVS